MNHQTTAGAILAAWNITASYIANGHVAEFSGRTKEGLVFRRVAQDLGMVSPGIKVELEVPFDGWEIDLAGSREAEHVAVEGKFKLRSDRAVPDNRKAAFFDLFKIESYVDSGQYSKGLFLWLTGQPAYLQQASGDSKDFSTHLGRVYKPGISLHARRSRNRMPLPLVLTRQYVFDWQTVFGDGRWYSLVLQVDPKTG